MPRLSALVPLLVGLVLLLAGLAPAAAQEASPAATGAAGEGFEPLAFAALEELPPGPALFALLRISYDPGASLPAIAFPGPLVGVVEAGTLSAQPDGPVEVQDPFAATPGAAAATPGAELTLEAGDQIVTPAGTGVAYANVGAEPASALVAAVLPADAPLPPAYPPGVTVRFLAAGVIAAPPPAPAALGIVRLTYGPGQADPEPSENPGPLLAAVEEGAVGYTLAGGEAQVVRGAAGAATPASAPAATPEAAVVGSEVILAAGDAVVEQGGASSSARNPGAEPAVVVLAVLGPPEAFAEEGAATPAATPAA